MFEKEAVLLPLFHVTAQTKHSRVVLLPEDFPKDCFPWNQAASLGGQHSSEAIGAGQIHHGITKGSI